MHPQRANILLQGLDRCTLTVGTISRPLRQTGGLLWDHFTNHGFTWSAKSTQEKQTSRHWTVEAMNMQKLGNKMNFSLCVNMSGFC